MMMCSDDKLSNQQCPQMMKMMKMMMMNKEDKRLNVSTCTTMPIPIKSIQHDELLLEEEKQKKDGELLKGGMKCPRCNSSNTKFCYYNNYSLSQPRHFCKSCKRYWTLGGSLRNVPVGGSSRRKTKPLKPRRRHLSSPPPPPPPPTPPLPPLPNPLIFSTNMINDPNYYLPSSFPSSSIDDDQLSNLGLIHSNSSTADDHLNYYSSFNHDNNYQPLLLPLDYHVLPCDNILNYNINLTSDHALYLNSGSDVFL